MLKAVPYGDMACPRLNLALGIPAGTGVPLGQIDRVLGIMKAYSTRVGGGPFPTELLDATGDQIRERGREYGTTTGRPRRCGWLDLVAVRYTAMVCGVTASAPLWAPMRTWATY